MSLDPISYSLVKRSRKAVIPSPREITEKSQFWYDEYTNNLKTYHLNKSRWAIIKKYIGYDRFDNNLENGIWTNYINIPISTAPSTSIQYKIEIAGDNINVYSNDGTTVLATGTGGLDFWGKVQIDGKDIRVFDETYGQNYFWIELFDITNQKCIIWTKINAGQTQLNIAYGNSDCLSSNYHSGGMTFEFFDDFEDGDISDWTQGSSRGSNSLVVENGYVRGSTLDAWNSMHRSISLPHNFIVEGEYELISDSNYNHILISLRDSINNIEVSGIYELEAQNVLNALPSTTGTATSLTVGQKYYWKFYRKTDDYTVAEIGGYSDTSDSAVSNEPDTLEVNLYNSNNKLHWIRIRKYLSDLTFGTPTIQQF